jgi:phage FluMu protein Com
MGYSMCQRQYGVHLTYDLTSFQILGQKFSKNFVSILVQTMTSKGHFEINWPLVQLEYVGNNVMYNNRDFVACNNLLTKVEFQMRKCPICHQAPSTCAPLHCTELCITQWGKIINLNKFFHSHDTIKTRTCFPGMRMFPLGRCFHPFWDRQMVWLYWPR